MKEGIFGIAMWCVPLLGGFMWAQAGNAPLTRSLLPEWALLSASGAVAMAALVGWAQPQKQPLWHPVPAVRLWTLLGIASIAGTLTTFLVLPPFAILSVPPYMEHRLLDALFPALHFPILSLILIPLQELYFRGRLLRNTGPVQSVLLFTLLACPFAPLYGLVMGSLLVWVHSRTHAVWTCIIVRVLAGFFGSIFIL